MATPKATAWWPMPSMAASHLNSFATDLQLTTAWNVNAAYEHFWSPRWRTSLYGGYAAVTYKQSANDMLCAQEVANGVLINAGAVAAVTPGFGANIGCNNDWKTWWIGSRTQWNVTKDFYMGLDVLYSKINTATGLNTTNFRQPSSAGEHHRQFFLYFCDELHYRRRRQLAVPLPRPSRLLSLIG